MDTNNLPMDIATWASGYGEGREGEYRQKCEAFLADMTPFQEVMKKFDAKMDLALYQEGLFLNNALCRLWNYAYNVNKTDVVDALKHPLTEKLFKFSKIYKRATGEAGILARYVCWTRYLLATNWGKVEEKLIADDLLYKSEKSVYVIGLHCKVGDNTFTVKGSCQYRDYVDTFSLQAFPVADAAYKGFSRSDSLPELPKYYEKTYFGDYKYHARPVSFGFEDRQFIQRNYLI